MKTRITSTPKRCLKFEGYIYLPENATTKVLRYYASRTPGRIVIYDEYGRPIGKKAFGFQNLSEAMDAVEKARMKLVYKRTKQ
jgi:hypothetical protein